LSTPTPRRVGGTIALVLGLGVVLGVLLPAAAADAQAGAPKKPSEIANVTAALAPEATGRGVLHVDVRILDGFHVNSHTPTEDYLIPTSLKIAPPEGAKAAEPAYPAGKTKKFSFADKPLSVYEGAFRIDVPMTWAGPPPAVSGTLDFQACTDTQCYAPASVPFQAAPGAAAAAAVERTEAPASTGTPTLGGGAVPLSAAPRDWGASSAAGAERDFQGELERRGLPLVLLAIFGGGLALNLTPCVYPVIPLTISFFGGQTSAGRRPFGLAAIYVLGMATMYSALGVAAALSGRLFGSALQSPWVLAGVALVLVALALSMFGLYDLRMPTALMQKAGARSGAMGAYGMGLLVGVVAAPCVGPFVLGLLAFVAARQQAGLGFLFFFVLSLGLGLPYLFLGAFSGSLSRLPRAGMWMESVKKAFGWVLLAMAAYFLRPALPAPAGGWILPAVLAIGAVAIALTSGWRPLARGAAAVVFLAAAFFFVPRVAATEGPAWRSYEAAKVAASGRPSIIDFAAAWCVPCRELDEKTFSDPRVREALRRRDLYKADLTRSGSADVAELSRKYAILGVPTIVFLDAEGRERTDLRLVGFEDADAFLARIAKAP
jgi:thiol:disulfide interchange protein DsbD